jgi:hypothetical protein
MARDILFSDTDGTLLYANGDFAVGKSDEQHFQAIIVSEKGHFKNAPYIGVGIRKYVNAPSSQREILEREIALQLKSDGVIDAVAKSDNAMNNIEVRGNYAE